MTTDGEKGLDDFMEKLSSRLKARKEKLAGNVPLRLIEDAGRTPKGDALSGVDRHASGSGEAK